MYEACALGIPSLVISQNETQNDEASLFKKAGAIIHLGLNETVSDDEILNNFRELMIDSSLREAISASGPKLISVNGSERIVSDLVDYYLEQQQGKSL